MISEVKKRDLFWAYFSTALNIGVGIILLPITLHYLSAVEVGLWFVFVTLGSLSQIFEPGFNSTIARNIAYLLSGANTLLKHGFELSEATRDPRSTNINLLKDFMYVSRKIYKWMAFLAIIFLMIFCSYYIYKIIPTESSATKVLFSWLFFSAGYVINLRSGVYIAFFQGRGEVSLANKVLILSRLALLFFSICFLMLGYGLIGVGIASLISSFLGFLLSIRFFQLHAKELASNSDVLEGGGFKIIFRVIWHNASRIGVVTLSTFLIQRAGILLASTYLGLEISGIYSLSITICMMLAGISAVIFQVQIPHMNALQIASNKLRLRQIFGMLLIISSVIYISGLLLVVCIGNDLLNLMASSSRFLPFGQFLALGIIFFMELINGLAGSYLMTANKILFVKSNLISGVLIILLSYFSVSEFSLGVWGLILCHGVVQLSYNNWKWISISVEDLGGNFIGLLIDGKNEIKRMIYDQRLYRF